MASYKVQLLKQPDSFVLKAENQSAVWSNTFKKNYIEQMTKRTGCFKKYEIFLKMMGNVVDTSTSKPIKSLTFKILTLSDLEKMRSTSVNKNENQSSVNKTDNKRYFILTYQTPYEQVHYPLPLMKYEDQSRIHTFHESVLNSTVGSGSAALQLQGSDGDTSFETFNSNNNDKFMNGNIEKTVIKNQQNDIKNLEAHLRKKSLKIKELKQEIDNLKSEKKLLIVKNNTLVMEISSYKKARIGHGGGRNINSRSNSYSNLYSLARDRSGAGRSGYEERGRQMRRPDRGSREPSPANLVPAPPRPGYISTTRLARSRSYERPWMQTPKSSRSHDRFGNKNQNFYNTARLKRSNSEERISNRRFYDKPQDSSRPGSRSNSQTRYEQFLSKESNLRGVGDYSFEEQRRHYGNFPSRSNFRRESRESLDYDRTSIGSAPGGFGYGNNNSRPVSRASSRGRFDPTAYIEDKQNKIKQTQINKRKNIRKVQAEAKPPILFYNNRKIPLGQKDFVQSNVEEYNSGLDKNDRNFNSTIDVDMDNIDARLNALQAYIRDLE